jgi:NADPH:quinone reductase-like Zn-dependent oxidoreductase
MLHEIRIQGHLDDRWADGIEDMRFTREIDGTTTLRAPLEDQAALHGLLNRIRDLNVPIVSVRREDGDEHRRTRMQAIVQEEYGSADTLKLREIDRPAIGDHDVLVRVHAAGLDRGVWHIMLGRPYLMRLFGFGIRKPKKQLRGSEVAGRVETVGKDVSRFRPGDEVFGEATGSFAEYASAAEGKLVQKPANVSFEQAAAVAISGRTALQAVRKAGRIGPGQKVLILGASGGVGTFAVQLAKATGAEVTGVASTAKLDLVRSIGADHVIDYTRQDFAHSGTRYDVILDIGGSHHLSHLRHALAPRGTLVLVGGEDDGRWVGRTVQKALVSTLLNPFTRQTLRPLMSLPDQHDLQILSELLEAGTLSPVIGGTYRLSDVPRAMRDLEAGRVRGKAIIAPIRGERDKVEG